MWLLVSLSMVVHNTKRLLITSTMFVIAVVAGQNPSPIFAHVKANTQKVFATTLLHLTSLFLIESLHLTLRLRAAWNGISLPRSTNRSMICSSVQCELDGTLWYLRVIST